MLNVLVHLSFHGCWQVRLNMDVGFYVYISRGVLWGCCVLNLKYLVDWSFGVQVVNQHL